VPENLQVLQALANQLRAAESSSRVCEASSEGWDQIAWQHPQGRVLAEVWSLSDTGQTDGDCCFTREISLTIALGQFPA